MALRRSIWLVRILGIFRTAAVLLIVGFLAVVSLVWCYHFYPDNRKEVVCPGKGYQRAFTENCGFNDISILLRASDWPWTFWKPVSLGELYWPEIQKSAGVNWSVDGSIIAFQNQRTEERASLFSAAYDYRKHELIGMTFTPDARLECDRRLRKLMNERGGIGPPQTDLDDFKDSNGLEPFPAWGWVIPGAFILGGVSAVCGLKKKRIPTIPVK